MIYSNAGFPIQGSCVQNHWVAPRLTQPFEVDKVSTRNFWKLSGKSKLLSQSGSSLEAVEPHP